jgi:protein-S-isoprenylcysteine O-methyltransferase Ste14
MKFFPAFHLGWLNGWLLLSLLVLTDIVLFLAFQSKVVKRLFDRSGWTRRQKILTVIGKMLALFLIVIIIMTPLKLGSPVLIIGCVLVALGLVGLIKALFDFKSAPTGQPATRGIYRITRHPQIMAASLVLLGTTVAIGSWSGLIVLLISRILLNANLVAEEEVCLRAFGSVYQEYLDHTPRYILF